MTYHITLDYDTYEEAREEFAWDIPENFNAAEDLVGKHADPKGRVGLFQAYPDGRRETYTFHDLDTLSNRLAHALRGLGVERGDRVGVVLSQKPANLLTHLACWKLGAISLPLSVLFGPDALEYRLGDSDAKVVVADASVRETVDAARENLPSLDHVVEVDGDAAGDARDFTDLLAGEPRAFDTVETDADTPALIVYTSGSTGPPKGVLHTHGVWLGHCPAYQMYFERDVERTVAWTPADWAWIGALGDLVFPSLHYGRPVVGYPMGKFDPETAFAIAEEFGVTDAFLPPTAIRMMMTVDDPESHYALDLKAVCSGGEPLTPEILDWAAETLDDVVVNELYGQTEANLLVTNCREWFDARAGSMGKPVPGHDVAVIDPETGEECGVDEVGELAVRRGGDAAYGEDPIVFEEYWKLPEKTAASRVGVPASSARGSSEELGSSGDWHLTGDLGYRDEDGYFWFKARDDDVIITAGYRVGPGEVESAILEHPAVAQVGVIGVPDATRGEIIKAFVQLAEGVTGDDALREEIRDLVRQNLARHEYPREIEFMDELPQTTTGKIQRRTLREREGVAD